jgi:signal transduction histidine kinase
MSSILFWTFNIFALIMVNTSIREREARLEAELTSRKLEATQNLLNEAVKQSERVRIARNIHDLLGHHLTALTINLQVASIKSDGEVKKSIEQCHQLAKLLLSDVREAVSDIRDKSVLDLESNITSMLDKIPNIKAEIEIDKAIQIDDIQIADAIIKTIQETITNTLKHAKGSLITIRIKNRDAQTDKLSSAEDKKQIQVDISNNGSLPNHIKQGNGLSGIQERLFALNGEAIFSINNKLFQTQLLIPVGQHD